jgi:predicted PurR-regulated permease PerM
MQAPPASIRFTPFIKWLSVLLVGAFAFVLFEKIHEVALVFVGSVIVAYIFYPVITWLTGYLRGSRMWATLLFHVVVLGVLTGVFIWIVPIISRQYVLLRQELPSALNQLSGIVIAVGSEQVAVGAEIRKNIDTVLLSLPARVPRLFVGVIEGFLHLLAFVIATFYLLLRGERVVRNIFHLVPDTYRAEVRHVGMQVHGILSGYIRGTLLLIPIMAVLTTVALWLLGVRYALLIGIISGVVEILPIIGPWSAAAFAIIMAIFQHPALFGGEAWIVAAVIGGIYFGLRMFEDYVIIPAVVGPAVHLHPVLVIAAILAGAAVGGVLGLFLAIPVTSVLQYTLRWLYGKLIDDRTLPTM